ncbi:PAS domain S-box protein [Polyangium jinanense]|uniref:PAS domain S-box protein n=1 Tax=Polyangium jinanense TaxID=2829994 RepID=A0A9X3X3H8_9BACT|nr:PAS domain S-box protein [Polyangium jinanense]MDC3954383.1 PAS domain S-box protein [Polyangium jinanense]MDC3980686.1 PAS domain S-box protein [Polyangium jinanense]
MSDPSASTYRAFLDSQARDLALSVARDAMTADALLGKATTAEVAAWSEAVVDATIGALVGEDGAAARVTAAALDLGRRGAPVDEVLRVLSGARRHFQRALRAGPASPLDAAAYADALDRLLATHDEAASALARCAVSATDAARCDGEARFRSLVNAVKSVVVIIGEDHTILEWNSEAERLYGWSRDEILGKNYLEWFVPAEARAAVAVDMRKVLGGEETRGFENPITSRDGTVRVLQWNVGRLRDGEGRAIAVVASGIDITDHKRDREALDRSEGMLHAVMTNAPIMLFVKDLEGRYTLTNRAFDEGMGFEPNFAIGKVDTKVLPPAVLAKHRADDQRVFDAGGPIQIETNIPTKNGVRVFLGSKFPLFDTNGKAYAICGIASDITDLRRAEAEQATFQVRIIEAQRETLRELSTPLLPIASGVVLMPLVGAIDESRAALVLEALLQGVVAHRAEVAILDITGVRTVDTPVALGLVQAAQAAGLLGADVVLTGVRPAAARTLVELGIDMRGIKTVSTLEQGVAHAIGRSGRSAHAKAPAR